MAKAKRLVTKEKPLVVCDWCGNEFSTAQSYSDHLDPETHECPAKVDDPQPAYPDRPWLPWWLLALIACIVGLCTLWFMSHAGLLG